MKTIWQYIEKHHEDYGAALFIVPVLLVMLAAISLLYGIDWLFD